MCEIEIVGVYVCVFTYSLRAEKLQDFATDLCLTAYLLAGPSWVTIGKYQGHYAQVHNTEVCNFRTGSVE
jgi:hypothetical protein